MTTNVLDGDVSRHWNVVDRAGRQHVISLFHDTVSGARAAMLDYEEVPESIGTSSVFMLGVATIVFYLPVTRERCQIVIAKDGFVGFSYGLRVSGKYIPETTAQVLNPELEFEVSVPRINLTKSSDGDRPVAWYQLRVKRIRDGTVTHVHRRFRDFALLYEQVDSMMKGHHLRSTLPKLPHKHLKLVIDHVDHRFLQERRADLEGLIQAFLLHPHVGTMDICRAFCGLCGNIREYSVIIRQRDVGLTLQRPGNVRGFGDRVEDDIGDGLTCPRICTVRPDINGDIADVSIGDSLVRVDGINTDNKPLHELMKLIGKLPCPKILHFRTPIIKTDSHATTTTTTSTSATATGDMMRMTGHRRHDDQQQQQRPPSSAQRSVFSHRSKHYTDKDYGENNGNDDDNCDDRRYNEYDDYGSYAEEGSGGYGGDDAYGEGMFSIPTKQPMIGVAGNFYDDDYSYLNSSRDSVGLVGGGGGGGDGGANRSGKAVELLPQLLQARVSQGKNSYGGSVGSVGGGGGGGGRSSSGGDGGGGRSSGGGDGGGGYVNYGNNAANDDDGDDEGNEAVDEALAAIAHLAISNSGGRGSESRTDHKDDIKKNVLIDFNVEDDTDDLYYRDTIGQPNTAAQHMTSASPSLTSSFTAVEPVSWESDGGGGVIDHHVVAPSSTTTTMGGNSSRSSGLYSSHLDDFSAVTKKQPLDNFGYGDGGADSDVDSDYYSDGDGLDSNPFS